MLRISFIALAVAGVLTGPAKAQQVSLRGEFVADSDCEATQRLSSGNPGNIQLEPGKRYEVIARNSTPGSHFRIRVPEAPSPEQRWVRMDCGTFEAAPGVEGEEKQNPSAGGEKASKGLLANGIENVLAASWQPGFCATEAGQGKPECESQTADRFDATNFAIHGLWPDDLDNKEIFPCWCDAGMPVSCDQRGKRAETIGISEDLLHELRVAMPGVQSGLHLHEWSKHGSCYEDDRTGADAGADPDEYYAETMALVSALNGSAVQDLFEETIGQVLTRQKIEAAFDQSFGEGAGDRVIVRCKRVGGENVITELWIGLGGEVGSSPDLAALIQAAPPTATSSNQNSCNSGRVVRVE